MTIDKFEGTFRMNAQGVALSAPAVAVSKDQRTHISVEGCDGGFVIVVAIEGMTEECATAAAARAADVTYERILLEIPEYIASPTPPRLERSIFTPAMPEVRRVFLQPMRIAITGGSARFASSIAPARLQPAIDQAQRELGDASVAGSNVDSARRLFRVAMETTDPVSGYLVCYGALQLFALSAYGKREGRYQQSIDRLLCAEDSLLTMVAGRKGPETIFTEARNRFIHAEDRGENPEEAMQLMGQRLKEFLVLTARILKR